MPLIALSKRSLDNLVGLHPDLVKVVTRAIQITQCDFGVICGLRTLDQEKINVANGASQTLDSRHLFGCAVDIEAFVDGVGSWDTVHPMRGLPSDNYTMISQAFFTAARELKIPLVWGGSWHTLKDYGHYELNKMFYPDDWRTLANPAKAV